MEYLTYLCETDFYLSLKKGSYSIDIKDDDNSKQINIHILDRDQYEKIYKYLGNKIYSYYDDDYVLVIQAKTKRVIKHPQKNKFYVKIDDLFLKFKIKI